MLHQRSLLLLSALVALAAGVLGCAREQPVMRPTPPVTIEGTGTAPGATATSTEPTQTAEETTATVGEGVALGTVVVTVTEAELSDEVDGYSPPQGRLLKLEAFVSNIASVPLALRSGDWSLGTTEGTVTPAAAAREDGRGQRTVEVGKTEDVTVVFEVPAGFGSGVLELRPEGSPEPVRVVVP